MLIVWTALALLGSLALLAHLLWLGFRGDNTAPLLPAAVRREHHVWYAFYVNPNDPRGIVPKTLGLGWTVNFRTMRQVWILLVLLALTLGASIALTVSAFS